MDPGRRPSETELESVIQTKPSLVRWIGSQRTFPHGSPLVSSTWASSSGATSLTSVFGPGGPTWALLSATGGGKCCKSKGCDAKTGAVDIGSMCALMIGMESATLAEGSSDSSQGPVGRCCWSVLTAYMTRVDTNLQLQRLRSAMAQSCCTRGLLALPD